MKQMKMNYLNSKGEIVSKIMKQIKEETRKNISWERMHTMNEHKYISKTEYEYLKKYLGEVTIFSYNNYKEYGYVHLYPHYQEIAIKNGAIDKREIKEVSQ